MLSERAPVSSTHLIYFKVIIVMQDLFQKMGFLYMNIGGALSLHQMRASLGRGGRGDPSIHPSVTRLFVRRARAIFISGPKPKDASAVSRLVQFLSRRHNHSTALIIRMAARGTSSPHNQTFAYEALRSIGFFTRPVNPLHCSCLSREPMRSRTPI